MTAGRSRLFLRVAAVLTMVALALMLWSIFVPTALPVVLAMSLGQGLGILAFAVFGYVVLSDLRTQRAATRAALRRAAVTLHRNAEAEARTSETAAAAAETAAAALAAAAKTAATSQGAAAPAGRGARGQGTSITSELASTVSGSTLGTRATGAPEAKPGDKKEPT